MPNKETVSICPAGEAFALPTPQDHAAEFERLQALVAKNRQLGREIVVVMGVGSVGAVMAGVVADATDRQTGLSTKFVIGMQRPSTR
ncbi:MAG: GDP-mannose dehydrogenase, partial [Desulfobacterales bacterium]|nr:GDP-mannose dehydrogenase [Desulfobacterales bacterium]